MIDDLFIIHQIIFNKRLYIFTKLEEKNEKNSRLGVSSMQILQNKFK